MSQEYDINEYWEQFDEKSRWIGFQDEKNEIKTEGEDLLDTIDWVVENEEKKEIEERENKDNQIEKKRKWEFDPEREEKIYKKLYGVKASTTFASDLDFRVNMKMTEIFDNIKKINKLNNEQF
jgi:hypothetical protein